jgi:hypothetical protein
VRRIKRVLVIVVALVLVAVLALVGLLAAVTARALPQVSGTIQVLGLRPPSLVTRPTCRVIG